MRVDKKKEKKRKFQNFIGPEYSMPKDILHIHIKVFRPQSGPMSRPFFSGPKSTFGPLIWIIGPVTWNIVGYSSTGSP